MTDVDKVTVDHVERLYDARFATEAVLCWAPAFGGLVVWPVRTAEANGARILISATDARLAIGPVPTRALAEQLADRLNSA